MWASMDQDGNPLSSAIAARQLVDRLVAAAWPPGNASGHAVQPDS
jgi:hypothetical protein